MKKTTILMLLAACLFLTIGCGGGGGGGGGNSKPIADAGVDQIVRLGDTAQLDGRVSRDPDGML